MRLYKICDCTEPCDHPHHYAFKHKGQLHRGTTHTGNSVLAKRMADKVRQDALAEGVGLPTSKRSSALSTHCAAYLVFARTDHPATADVKDARVLAQLQAVIGDKRLDQIRAFDLERWRTGRADDVSRATVNRELNVVYGLFSKAVEWGRIAKSPCVSVRKWDTDEQPRRVLSADEVRHALTGLPPRYALMCRVTLECLARLSEVLGLTRADVGPDWIARRLKGGARLRVGVTPELTAALRAELRTLTQEHIFGDPPPRQEATSSYFTRLFRGLELPGVSHHAMRHTGVTLMLDEGRNPQVIQRLAGWTSMRMLERYGHVRDAEMVKAVEGNAAYLRKVLA